MVQIRIFKVILFVLIFISISPSISTATFNELHPFTSDGCSTVPDGTLKNPQKWQRCCIQHDIEYWAGGSKEERKSADFEFFECLKSKQNTFLALIYLGGVRMGGNPNFPTTFRWGYGWKYNRGYRPLNSIEKALVERLRPKDLDIIDPTQKAQRSKPYPTETGNYCIDEVNRHLKLKNPDLKVHQIVSEIEESKIIYFKADQTSKIYAARFNVPSLSQCRLFRYSDTPTEYLQFIYRF